MRTIALVNQKGGCGKTTTAINLASCLALEGKRVLLIDLDPQGHSGLGLGVQPGEIKKSIYEVLLGRIKINEAVYVISGNLHIVLSDVVLSAFEQVMSGVPEREYRLRKSLADLTCKYDYMLIDCPPSVGLLTFNGLMVCSEVIVPVDPSFFSLHGLDKLLQTIKLLQERGNRTFSVRILATNIDERTRYAKDLVTTLREKFPGQCFEVVIHAGTRLREAASLGKPIAAYDKTCRAFHDYRSLTLEVLNAEYQMARPEMPGTVQQMAEKTVVFDLEAPAHSDVRIAGDFNNWNPESLSFSDVPDEPRWRKRFSLKPGSYRYKYLLDGQWIEDPGNDKTVDDSFGGINSLINI